MNFFDELAGIGGERRFPTGDWFSLVTMFGWFVGHIVQMSIRRGRRHISVYLRRWRFRVLLESASRLTISLQCVRVLTSPVVGRMAASISRSMYSLSRHRLRRWAQLISPGGNRFCRADHSFDEQAGKQLTV